MPQDNFLLIFGPSWLLVSFLIYWPLFFRHQKEGASGKIIRLRYFGAFIFGFVPSLVVLSAGFDPVDVFGLSFNIKGNAGIWLAGSGIGILIIIFNFFMSKRKDNLKEFPQIRDPYWSVGLVIHNSISWIIYLIGYEMLFRGLMVFPLIPVMGFWPAAVIGTVMYSLSHYPKSLPEALGAIPFSLLLVYLAWESQSVWICVLIHACLAVSNSLFSFYHHPELRFKGSTA